MKQAEREYFTALMVESQWNHSVAAKAAGLNRTSMYRVLERNGITRAAAPVIQKRPATAAPCRKPIKRLKVDPRRILDLKVAGFVPNDISGWLQVTPSYVRQILRGAAVRQVS
jgi:hypothetical protein